MNNRGLADNRSGASSLSPTGSQSPAKTSSSNYNVLNLRSKHIRRLKYLKSPTTTAAVMACSSDSDSDREYPRRWMEYRSDYSDDGENIIIL